MVIAPKGRGWSVTIVDTPESHKAFNREYSGFDSPVTRNRYWSTLRKKTANGSRYGRI